MRLCSQTPGDAERAVLGRFARFAWNVAKIRDSAIPPTVSRRACTGRGIRV